MPLVETSEQASGAPARLRRASLAHGGAADAPDEAREGRLINTSTAPETTPWVCSREGAEMFQESRESRISLYPRKSELVPFRVTLTLAGWAPANPGGPVCGTSTTGQRGAEGQVNRDRAAHLRFPGGPPVRGGETQQAELLSEAPVGKRQATWSFGDAGKHESKARDGAAPAPDRRGRGDQTRRSLVWPWCWAQLDGEQGCNRLNMIEFLDCSYRAGSC